MDQKSLEEKSRLSEAKRNKLDNLNAALDHSSSVKKEMWLDFNDQLRKLVRSKMIGIAD